MIHEPLKFTKDQVTFGRKFIAEVLNAKEEQSAAVIEYEGVIHRGRKVVTFCQVNTVNQRYDLSEQIAEIMKEEIEGSFTLKCKITLKPM